MGQISKKILSKKGHALVSHKPATNDGYENKGCISFKIGFSCLPKLGFLNKISKYELEMPDVFVFYLFLFLHVHVHTHVRACSWFYGCPCVYVHVHWKSREQHLPSGISGPIIQLFFFFLFSFELGSLPGLGLAKLCSSGPLVSHRNPSVFASPQQELQPWAKTPAYFYMDSGDSNQVCSKYFTHWAVSQVHLFAFYSWALLCCPG